MSGILYIVSTPIGNLDDITHRAIKVLSEVDLIAAEDTRHTLKLLNYFEIKKPLTSYHEHNKGKKGESLLNNLLSGKNIALVSDAGTPAISDPGEDLIKTALENDVQITSIPGASAIVNGLILSGFSTSRFAFEGFLPKNKNKRKKRLQEIKNDTRTLIFYESPYKLLATLKDILQVFGNRRISLAKEMTKKFEEIIRTTVEELINMYSNKTIKGEFVLVIEGCSGEAQNVSEEFNDLSIKEHVANYVSQGLQKKEAMKKVAKERGISKREVYNIEVREKGKK